MPEWLRLQAGGLRCGGAMETSGWEWIRTLCFGARYAAFPFRARDRSSTTMCGCMTDRRRPCIRDFRVRCLQICRLVSCDERREEEMTEFEGQVLADLSVLKNQMSQLMGIGQPGRLIQLEERVERHERSVQRIKGL